MKNEKLIYLSPLKAVGYDGGEIVPEGGLGAVAAHAGVGKTALLVQLALSAMLSGAKVLHISLNDSVNKVNLWYQELFSNIVGQTGPKETREIWESIVPNRFIMTFKAESFNASKLEGCLNDLITQNIFPPGLIIVDGLRFDESVRGTLVGMKSLAKRLSIRLWFTVHIHSYEGQTPDNMPKCLLSTVDLFDAVFKLQPEGGEIFIKMLKGIPAATSFKPLLLDPSTMLIRGRS